MQNQEQSIRVIERLAIDHHVDRLGFARRIAHGDTADGDGMFFQKVSGLTARAVAEVGEELIETAHEKTQRAAPAFGEPASAGIDAAPQRTRSRGLAAAGFATVDRRR